MNSSSYMGFLAPFTNVFATKPAVRLLTLEQAAARLQIPARAVKSLCQKGRLEGAKKIGSSGWRIPEPSLDQFIQSKTRFVSTNRRS
jgi:excisionase family DNA binding protein